MAVRVWLPTGRPEAVKLAVPLAMGWVLSVVVPSLKVTVPVAVEGITAAVRVTTCPKTAGFGETTIVVVEGATIGVPTTENAPPIPDPLGVNQAGEELKSRCMNNSPGIATTPSAQPS